MRQIDKMTPGELEIIVASMFLACSSLAEKAMQPKQIDQKRLSIQHERINACDTLIDHILDDIPHKDQQPLLDLLRTMRGNLEDEMEDNVSVS